MSKGNRGLGISIVDNAAGVAAAPSSLSRLETAPLVIDRTEWVDPARCRPWKLHNRVIELLDEESCSDLIGSLKAEGRQRIPAIVRRLHDDPDHDYEIIAGVRRWWTISWLRAHHYPDFQYLVTIQSVTDEEGFRLADIENRARKDISDLERAKDYLRALDLFYGGSQSAMADRMNVSKGWMSRMLEVGRLPQEIVEAFADPRTISARHAGQLAPGLRRADVRDRILAEAVLIAERRHRGEEIEPHRVVASLLAVAGEAPRRGCPAIVRDIATASGKPMLRVESRGPGTEMTIRILPGLDVSRTELRTALLGAIDPYFER